MVQWHVGTFCTYSLAKCMGHLECNVNFFLYLMHLSCSAENTENCEETLAVLFRVFTGSVEFGVIPFHKYIILKNSK